ncbi:acetyl-CoA C-acyltransferase [Arthrobacter psychrolactophilus]|uniref:Acetyl-CoA C-acyltransferase n=1 Tax=Arthrobacter psychrolactophilus TaxID=92442 RepID=A0A2V5IQY4_9MICC|nr:thiolase family protein [Arthrobacter psychrolactophilus]PYI38441.1 acetyl-CoA C-acyltransferase [Arthrobacter psychrolactophilus]
MPSAFANSPDTTPVIIAAKRLPIAKVGGAYKDIRAHMLASAVLEDLVRQPGVAAAEISDVILGNATGGGGNVARLSALTAGLPESIPGLTVDRQCGSGLEAIVLACRLIQAGAGELYLAGGVESISTAPARAHRGPQGELEFFDRAQFAPYETGDPDAGEAAENVASHYKITRQRQDAYALESHRRAVAAAHNGHFDEELIPFASLTADQGPRATLSASLLARFPAAFVPGGTVTAGNSCPYSDGAAIVAVTTLARARKLAAAGLVFCDSAVTGNDPTLLGVAAAHSTRALMRRTGLSPERLRASMIEYNEAFAAQVLATADLLELDPALFNHDGGALALGHPYGASGAVLVTRLLARARREDRSAADAVAMISMAGGIGISAQFQWRAL